MDEPAVDLVFDARHINQSGIGTYISAQIPHLESTLTEHNRTLAVLANSDAVPPVGERTRVILAEPSGAAMYSVPEQRAWARVVRGARPKAIWVPHYPFPFTLLRRSQRTIQSFVTVHDDNHLLPADISGQGAARRAYARTMLEIDARKVSRIFTPSQAAADALAKVAPRASFTVTPIPVNQQWLDPVDPLLSPVQGRYISYLGNIKRHKNLLTLLQAFAQVLPRIPHKLVIAGSGATVHMLDDRVHALAAELGDRVQIIGRLEFGALHSLVAGADLLVMPSFNEGAGLPPLEAMASHTAVLSSDIPSLRETCGDGADYFDPRDPGELAALIHTYCCDDDARAALASRGWNHVTTRQARLPNTVAAETICASLDLHGT